MQSKVQVGIGTLALCSIFPSCRSTNESAPVSPFYAHAFRDASEKDARTATSYGDGSKVNGEKFEFGVPQRESILSSASFPSYEPQSPSPRYTPKKVDNLPDGPTLSLGYKSIPVDFSFTHDTHPDDHFLPNANVRGSAGTTRFNEPQDFFALGVGYNFPISESSLLTTEGGVLLGSGSDRRQNANDSRPPEEGAFIYSEAALGLFGTVGIQKHLGNFYFGLDAQLALVSIESGWERFGRQDSQDHQTEWIPSVGPKVGFRLGVFSVQADLQVGEEVGFGIKMAFADPD